jgi:hypothetical protein
LATHPAKALTVFPQTGPSRSYVRIDDDGHTRWSPAVTTFGRGAPHEPVPGAPQLTPSELIELLAAELQ